jgi:hypothetical protein
VRRECSILQNQTTEFRTQWHETRVAFIESSLRAIKDYLDETRERALDETSLLVREEANENADGVYVRIPFSFETLSYRSIGYFSKSTSSGGLLDESGKSTEKAFSVATG